MNDVQTWLISVLGAIDVSNRSEFSGLGLLFYTDRRTLPVHPLARPDCGVRLPTKTVQESIESLAQCSRRTSDCHDGFHLIDAETLSITDVSQFLSPPIPSEPLTLERMGGARHMAARLASLIPEVKITAVYTKCGGATLYERGNAKTLRIPAIRLRHS